MVFQVLWLLASPFVAHGTGSKDADNGMKLGGTDYQSNLVVLPTPCQVHRPSQPSSKALLRHERDSVPHYVEGCPRQLVRERVVGYRDVRLLHLAIIKCPGLSIIASGDLSSLGKGPCKVLVAALLVSFPFDLVVADPLTRHLPAIRDIVACFGKPSDGTRFKHDRKGENLTDTRNGEQHLIRFAKIYPFHNRRLNSPNLAGEEIYALFAHLARQCQILVRRKIRANPIRL